MKLTLLLLLILTVGCKTQEDIRREKNLEVLNEQVTQTQKSSANNQSRFDSLEREVAKLSGNIEEFAHNRGSEQKEVLLLKDRIKTLEETISKQNENMVALSEKFNEQSKFIEEVHATLKDMSGKEVKKTKEKSNDSEEKTEVSKAESIQAAVALIKSKNYTESKEMLLNLLENKKLKKKEKPQAIFYLGQIEFRTKNFDEAKVYFSKLYTEYPESSLNSVALLNLAKSFIQLKSKEEAKQTLEELMDKFPGTKEATEAKSLKAKI